MRVLAAALLLALVAPALAGCIETPASDVEPQSALAPDAIVAAPAVDGAATLAAVKAYAEAFPMRRGNNDAHNAARDFLLKGFTELGYESFMDEFTAPVSRTSTPTNVMGDGRLVNIVGIKWGTTLPNEWIVVGAHYDVTDGAIYGAYDDGSGTMIVQALAAAYKDVPTERTIVFVNFDGEEQGLQGSRHFATAVTEGTWAITNGTVVGMIDFDMAGINYPADPPLVADVVSPEMEAVIEAKRLALGMPDGSVAYRGISGGSSDNGPFKALEIPSVLFISDFDEVVYRGVALPSPAVTYPFWHKADTYQGMVELAGGEANLKAGFQNVVDLGSELLWQMSGNMTLTFQAR